MKSEVIHKKGNTIFIDDVWEIIPAQLVNLRTNKKYTVKSHKFITETNSANGPHHMYSHTTKRTVLFLEDASGISEGDLVTNQGMKTSISN
jgi:predicted patatin/cPLA2 family phospholipase